MDIIWDFGGQRSAQTVVLLIEADYEERHSLADLLGKHGFYVLSASNVAEALFIVADCTGVINLLLVNVLMPATDGFTCARHVVTKRPGIKVLFMTHSVVRFGEPDIKPNYECDFIQKPFDTTILLDKIDDLLART